MLRSVWARRGALAAAATAGSASFAFCNAPAAKVPPFVLGGDRYDQTTFEGRLAKIQEMIDVRTVLTTDDELARCQAKLAEFKALGRAPDGTSDEQLWEAQRTVDAIIHGPTGEKMWLPGRMSMFVPMNIPATAGMIMARSVPVTLFWQWMNQTYNVVNNYVCRAGPEVEMAALAQSYGLAVTVSCSIAVGAGKLLKAFPRLQMFGLVVPYLAVISAGTCNVCFTRMDEIRNGIFVADKDGKVVGRSVSAGQTAVYLTVTTRSMFIPLFSLIGPPLMMKGVYATGAVVAGSAMAMALEVGAVAAMLALGLPFALALQPLQMELDVDRLEPEFRGLTTADGAPLRHVYASKGM
mmetsp:Transcript_11146/g.22575  ORF Transcript_11146/g.22575 Transcript_11146/m.22575 type:complete len:352 (+) Transcript_11146:33-1088(+)